MWMYLAVFLAAFVVDIIPVFAPPAWMAMVFFQEKFDLNVWGVLGAGVTGSVLGRYCLSLYIPKVSGKLLKRGKNEDLEYLGKKLGDGSWKRWLFVFIYTLTPLSTTALFTAAGIAKVNPMRILPPFFCGKFISDTVMLLTARHAVGSLGDILHGTFSVKGLITAALGLLLIAGVLFIDWRELIQRKKFKLRFKIWK